ncbi:MAG TPA: hypothetical protein VE954_20340 [Oligoflexus sp.]|uniref:hypothetical protein n=1 Tax=Oligoflexus sp. TaxID=1971216 RepID=UPI002D557C1A|nr:hypothetical protein [Oligoflexus sp.]HYX35451.1 hypothetical protein [Oligoflexus sp.]
MRVGTVISLPNDYSRFARVQDADGTSYTADPSVLPKGAKEGSEVAYKVEIWSNDSGLVYDAQDK